MEGPIQFFNFLSHFKKDELTFERTNSLLIRGRSHFKRVNRRRLISSLKPPDLPFKKSDFPLEKGEWMGYLI